jgi:histidinol-phosphate aminotransferase
MNIEDALSLVRPHLLNLQPYSSARDEFDQSNVEKDKFIYLDANESPYNTDYNRYPDPYQHQLKKKLASIKKVQPEQIFIGNGSDEAIDLIIRLFCNDGDNIIIPSPTYGMYKVSAEINNVKLKTCLLNDDFSLPNIKTDTDTKVVFLCSPNNPSGNSLDIDLDSFNCIVVVDEAYIDFSTRPSFVNQLDNYPNLIVLQTLSKAWGLAGIRLGMAFAHPKIISLLNKIKPPYNINTATQKVALEALDRQNETDERVRSILFERMRVAKLLLNLKSVKKVYPSDANFLLVRIDDARDVYTKLVSEGIVVRDRSQVRLCEDCLRITIGTHEENEKLLAVLRKLS